MDIKLYRIALRNGYTIGRLFINGVYECDTLEDSVRDYNKDGDLNDNGECKVYASTAIPYGRYEIVMNAKSQRFSQRAAYSWCDGYLPRLLDVPHFDGILIHAGNTQCDTAGCILVGYNKVKGRLTDSMLALKRLYAKLKSADDIGERIWITIV